VPPTARRLADALARLVVDIDAVDCAVGAVAVPSYPGGPRPTSTVTLAGRGKRGRGEHVGWSVEAHEGFARRATELPRGRRTVGAVVAELASGVSEPYDRAALEAAAIDLALRQAGATLGDLAGVTPRPIRYVVSFACCADPAAEARRHGDVELKVDADPRWGDAVFAALAAAGRVAVVDWKRTGSDVDHERGRRHLPAALVEDPGVDPCQCAPALHPHLALDAPILRASDLDTLPVRPAALNLKPARMGGVLEALAAAAWADDHQVAIYVGGMFELGVGRGQLQALAAVLSPDGPNDVAPIARDEAVAQHSPRLPVGSRPGSK
jgi:L-alanine-DL-glutamate epimerase-like enolase superfamily enzyme